MTQSSFQTISGNPPQKGARKLNLKGIFGDLTQTRLTVSFKELPEQGVPFTGAITKTNDPAFKKGAEVTLTYRMGDVDLEIQEAETI